MKQVSFNLKSFAESDGAFFEVSLKQISYSCFSLSFELFQSSVPLGEPGKFQRGSFREGLWNENCCELFWGLEGDERYWEWNFSPQGDWASWAFEGYRVRSASLFERNEILGLSLLHPRRFELQLNLCENELFAWALANSKKIQLNLTAVLKTASGLEYFAIAHAEKADFHRRDLWQPISL